MRAVDARRPDTERTAEVTRPRRTDIRTALAVELKTLLDAAERDRANHAAAE